MNGLLVLKLLAPAISNPVISGLIGHADLDALKLMSSTAKIIQHCWVGKPIEIGELCKLQWLNDAIPNWQK